MAREKPGPAIGDVMTEEEIAQLEMRRQMMTMPETDQYGTADDDPDDVALANVVAELGSDAADAVVNVYQVDEKKNRAFVGSFAPADFSIGLIQAQFGAGEYRVEVRQNKKWLKKSTIRIAAPKVNPLAAIAAPAPAVETGKIIESMQSGFAQMGQMFAAALGQLAQNQPKPKSSMEMLQELAMMKELMGGNSAPQGPDPMRLFEMATEIADKINPRQGEPGAGEMIMEAMKNFAPLINKAAEQSARPAMAPAPMIAPANPAPVVPNPANPEQDQMKFARKMYLNLLVSNAQAGNDTMTYANMLLDVAGETAALEFAHSPTWFETLCAEEPMARQFPDWFAQLRNDVIELTKPESDDMNNGIPPAS